MHTPLALVPYVPCRHSGGDSARPNNKNNPLALCGDPPLGPITDGTHKSRRNSVFCASKPHALARAPKRARHVPMSDDGNTCVHQPHITGLLRNIAFPQHVERQACEGKNRPCLVPVYTHTLLTKQICAVVRARTSPQCPSTFYNDAHRPHLFRTLRNGSLLGKKLSVVRQA
jgi:hypothetical protein